jgi:phage/plasmid-like protein (TIGR03299 family)
MGAVPETSFYVNERGVPWHGLGEGLGETPEKRLAQVKAGLDWEAEKQEMFLSSGGPVPGSYAVVRSTDSNVLGVVGAKYAVIQPRDLFEIVEACLTEGAKFETGGQLFNGRLIWALARTEGCVDAITGDEIKPYLLLTNTFDGSQNLQGCLTAVRAVCENTIGAAIAEGERHIKIRHTAGWTNKVAEARRILGAAKSVFAGLQEELHLLANTRLNFGSLDKFLDRMIPLPAAEKGAVLDRALSDRATLGGLIMSPTGGEFGRGTLYQALSGITEFASHAFPAHRKVGTPEQRQERRFFDLVINTGGARTRFVEKAVKELAVLAE